MMGQSTANHGAASEISAERNLWPKRYTARAIDRAATGYA